MNDCHVPEPRKAVTHSKQKVVLVCASVVCNAVFSVIMHNLQSSLLRVSSRLQEIEKLKLEHSTHLRSMAELIDVLQEEYSFVVSTVCPLVATGNNTWTSHGVCGTRFEAERMKPFTRNNIEQEYTKVQLRVDDRFQQLFAFSGVREAIFGWWSTGQTQLHNLKGEISSARVTCDWAFHIRGPTSRAFDAHEIDSCIAQYFWLWEATYRLMGKTASPEVTAMLQFDSWLVIGPARYAIDGVQAWATVATHDVQSIQGTTPTVVAALQGLSRYLQYLYSYFSVFVAISSLSPTWIFEQLESMGLTSHQTWLSRAMLLNDLYFKGGNAFLPPNWSQELLQGSRSVNEFGRVCANRHEDLIIARVNRHQHVYLGSFVPLSLLCLVMFIVLIWLFWVLVLSPPSKADSNAARRLVSRFVQAQVEGSVRAASAGLEWMQQSMPPRQLVKPAFREPALFLQMHAGATSRWLARIQAAAEEGVVHKRAAASCDTCFLLNRVACQYRAISRANVQVDCDVAIPSTLYLRALSLFHVLSSLVDSAVQRSEHSDVHVSCRFLSPTMTANLREWHVGAFPGTHASGLHGTAERAARTACRRYGCQSNSVSSQGSLLFSIVDGGDTLRQDVLTAMSSGQTVASDLVATDAVSAVRRVVMETFGGIFMASTRPEHEDGTFVLFTVALTPQDTARVEREGQAWLAQAAQKAGPGLISTARTHSMGQKHSIVVPHIGRVPLRWPSRKLYSTREDNLRPAVQQFYSTHYRRLMSTDMLSDDLQLTSCVIVDFNVDTVRRLNRLAQDSGRRVLVCETGQQAVGAWQRRTVAMVDCDVLLMRVDLPQLSGPTVAHMLLQQRFTGKIVLYHDQNSPAQPVNAKLDVLPQKWTDMDVKRRLLRRNRTAGVLAQDNVVLPGT